MTAVAVAGTRRTMKELADGTIRVQIDIDPPQRADFLRLFPAIDMPVALAPMALDSAPPPPVASSVGAERLQVGKEVGAESSAGKSLAERLMINGFFRNPHLWRAMHDRKIYTYQQHKNWLERQKCRLWKRGGCEGRVVVHHCASASLPAAGPQRQPDAPRKVPHTYGLPLCSITHHQNFAHNSATREEKEELLIMAVALTEERMVGAVKAYLGIQSRNEITQEMLDRFEEEMGL